MARSLFVDALRINSTVVITTSTAITTATNAVLTATAAAAAVNLPLLNERQKTRGGEKQNSAARFSAESNRQLSRRGRKPGVTKQLICCGIIRSVGCGRD